MSCVELFDAQNNGARQLWELRPCRDRRITHLSEQEDATGGQRDTLRTSDAKIIKEGVKIRVLTLSSTPVNNRMADL